MCGRFTLATPTEILAELFEVLDEAPAPLPPRYNIAPTQPVVAVRVTPDDGARHLALFHWGLIPFWSKDPSMGARMINARAETAAEKPAYRAAFKRRRCLIPADGFYEWRKEKGRKQPYYFHPVDERPFALAGLWERWSSPEGDVLESCTILTTEANDLVRPVHARMPVILPPENHALWLDPEVQERGPLEDVLEAYDPALMVAYPVSTHVNSPRNDDPGCIVPQA